MRQRLPVLFSLALLIALAWLYTIHRNETARMEMAVVERRSLPEAGLGFVMWTTMMVAMMTPSAMPFVLAFDRMAAGASSRGTRTALFVAGYLLTWTSFAAVAALAQWALHNAPRLSTSGIMDGSGATGALLLAAGAYQLSPLKNACLAHCRTPLGFFLGAWRDGAGGALRMGLHHGVYCLGCCVFLMMLLFAGGAMDLRPMAALTLLVAIEKMAPWGDAAGYAAGMVLMSAGAVGLAGG